MVNPELQEGMKIWAIEFFENSKGVPCRFIPCQLKVTYMKHNSDDDWYNPNKDSLYYFVYADKLIWEDGGKFGLDPRSTLNDLPHVRFMVWNRFKIGTWTTLLEGPSGLYFSTKKEAIDACKTCYDRAVDEYNKEIKKLKEEEEEFLKKYKEKKERIEKKIDTIIENSKKLKEQSKELKYNEK